MNKKNILVVGATGFIGSSLIEQLVQDQGNEIFAIGRKESQFISQVKENFQNFRFIKCDLTKVENSIDLPENIDMLYYLVSGTYPAKSWDNPKEELELNLLPLINFMGVIVKSVKSLDKLVFLSSGGTVYGETEMRENGYEESQPNRPFVPYGIFKKAQEDLLRYYSKRVHYTLYNYRVGNVYGPNYSQQKDFGVINIWLDKIIKNQPLQIFGSQNIIRDFIYIKDLVQMLVFPSIEKVDGGDYNISTGEHYSLQELLEMIIQISPLKVEVENSFGRDSDVSAVVLNGAKFNKICKLNSTSMLRGMKDTFAFLINESKK